MIQFIQYFQSEKSPTSDALQGGALGDPLQLLVVVSEQLLLLGPSQHELQVLDPNFDSSAVEGGQGLDEDHQELGCELVNGLLEFLAVGLFEEDVGVVFQNLHIEDFGGLCEGFEPRIEDLRGDGGPFGLWGSFGALGSFGRHDLQINFNLVSVGCLVFKSGFRVFESAEDGEVWIFWRFFWGFVLFLIFWDAFFGCFGGREWLVDLSWWLWC